MRRPPSGFLSFVVGVAVCVASWLAFVPWDLSEVDAEGRALPEGGEDYASDIAVAFMVALLLLLLASRIRQARIETAGLGALLALVVMFSWRAAASTVVGANLWPIGLLFVVLPGGAIGFGLAVSADRWLDRRSRRGSPRS